MTPSATPEDAILHPRDLAGEGGMDRDAVEAGGTPTSAGSGQDRFSALSHIIRKLEYKVTSKL
jgi:hypothetical protein